MACTRGPHGKVSQRTGPGGGMATWGQLERRIMPNLTGYTSTAAGTWLTFTSSAPPRTNLFRMLPARLTPHKRRGTTKRRTIGCAPVYPYYGRHTAGKSCVCGSSVGLVGFILSLWVWRAPQLHKAKRRARDQSRGGYVCVARRINSKTIRKYIGSLVLNTTLAVLKPCSILSSSS